MSGTMECHWAHSEQLQWMFRQSWATHILQKNKEIVRMSCGRQQWVRLIRQRNAFVKLPLVTTTSFVAALQSASKHTFSSSSRSPWRYLLNSSAPFSSCKMPYRGTFLFSSSGSREDSPEASCRSRATLFDWLTVEDIYHHESRHIESWWKWKWNGNAWQ